jgi:hypothetical protein
MKTPYRNRLPMAYLPASRAVDSVGLDPMFRGRVSGVGTAVAIPLTTEPAAEPPKTDWVGIVIRVGSIYGFIKNLSK